MSSDAGHIISANKVNKWYGQFHALHDVSFQVATGERIVICGPSGSGKSTFLRCLNRLENFQSGQISVNGIVLHDRMRDVEKLRADVGMVFQNFNLFPHLTILENLILAPMSVRKIPLAEAIETANVTLRRVRISDQAHKFPSQLSGGQQQRAAIARSLCMMPKILLFDEPTSALDPEMVAEVLDVIIELAKTGITMVCVTHEMGFARKVADRVAFFSGGVLVEQKPAEQFFKKPEDPRLKTFLGQVINH